MFTQVSDSKLFVRLDPGEQVVAGIKSACHEHHLTFGSIVSGVGMLTGLNLGFFQIDRNDYEVTSFGDEILDLSSIAGNIALRDGALWPHVHVVSNRPDFSTVSGHLIEARCHITVEVFIELLNPLGVIRRAMAGLPATRLCAGP